MFAADLDGDGDADILSASYGNDAIAWYENTDGKGSFGNQQTVTASADGASDVYAADVDGDGDMDVVSASLLDDKIAWYENTDGKGNFGPQNVISTAADGAWATFAVDVDGDGDVDALSASALDDKIAWYENTDGNGSFGPQKVITTAAESARSVYAADVDGDGDTDVLSASAYDDKIAWYENTDGTGNFGPQKVIADTRAIAYSVYAMDVDGDGDVDAVSLSGVDTYVAWYENTDGKGSFGPVKGISITIGHGTSVYGADVDGDGDMDVLAASQSYDNITWFENTDGEGSFRRRNVITTVATGARSVYAVDVDGDGDVDVLSASRRDDKIAWYENTDGEGNFGPQKVITETAAAGASWVYSSDIDGDGDADVLSASYLGGIAWYENTDGTGGFGPRRVITAAADGARSAYAVDIDGDGDMDVLAPSYTDHIEGKIAWYENTDGMGDFGPPKVITTAALPRARSLFAADVDGDADMDVVFAPWGDNTIVWYENTDGKGSFGPQRVIATISALGGQRAYSVHAADMDGDGDVDVLAAISSGDKITWYENIDGKGNFGPVKAIPTAAAARRSVYAVDIDGDGDVDVLSAEIGSLPGIISWYENTDGKGGFGPQQVVSTEAPGSESVYAADVDGDGDVDVLSTSSVLDIGARVWDDEIAWYENTDGEGSFGPRQVITTAVDGARSVYTADVDGDGDADVLSASYQDNRIAWYENSSPQPGDANCDFQFDQQDIVRVLQAAKYLTGEPATFEEGDWNGDGVFSQFDIVAALQTGNYLNETNAVRMVDAVYASTVR